MPQCFDAECRHKTGSYYDGCKFFSFPTENGKVTWSSLRKQGWSIVADRRKDKFPARHDVLCSCHFKDGVKTNKPTVFQSSAKKRLEFADPEPPRKRQRKIPSTAAEDEETEAPAAAPFFSPEATTVIISTQEKEIEDLKRQVAYSSKRLVIESIAGNDEMVTMFTGVSNYQTFLLLLKACRRFNIKYYAGWAVTEIRLEEQLLMALMKLRHNYNNLDLAHRFGTSKTTVSNITITIFHVLHRLLVKGLMERIPSRRRNLTSLPQAFADFQTTRIVIDCTEVGIEVPGRMDEQNKTYSNYKSRNTFKGLVGVAPNGVITFVSDLYGGCTSDKQLTVDSCILDQMEPGDSVMADKGFTIHDVLPCGVGLNIPPFLHGPQFTQNEVIMTRSIARARIHVERAIKRVKGFAILDYIPASLRPFSSIVFQVCGALTSFQNPLIREVFAKLNEEQ